MNEAIKAFERKFGVRCEWTGYEEMEPEEFYEAEYWVHDLIKSEVVFIEVGGWFRIDADGTGSCLLGVKFEGQEVNPEKALQSWYDGKGSPRSWLRLRARSSKTGEEWGA